MAARGSTRAQAETSRGHILIGLNIFRAIDPVASQQGGLTYTSDMKRRIEHLDNFYSPDVMVVCGQDHSDLEATFETAPCLLVEVLSKSTARIDRLVKQVAYTGIPSLQTYLIVEQSKRTVYVYQSGGRLRKSSARAPLTCRAWAPPSRWTRSTASCRSDRLYTSAAA